MDATICNHVATEEIWIDKAAGKTGYLCHVCGAVLDKSLGQRYAEEHEQERQEYIRKAGKTVRTNQRGQTCWKCGGWVKPGEGELIHVDQEMEGSYNFQSGWLVRHLCKDDCQQVEDARQAEEIRLAQVGVEIARDAKVLEQKVVTETGLKPQFDWSWDNYSYSKGKQLAESAHHVAREYLAGDQLIGFIIEKKSK